MFIDPFIILYTLFLLFILLVRSNMTKSNVFINFFVILIFSILASYRSLNVPDTKEYIQLYYYLNEMLFDFQFRGEEKGFLLVLKVAKIFNFSYELLFFAISFFSSLLVLKAIKNFNVDETLGLIVFYSFYGLYFNFIIIRFGISFSFFLLALSYSYRGEKAKCYSLFVFSSLFHFSSIFGIFIYFILQVFNRKVPKGALLFIIFSSIIFELLDVSSLLIKDIIFYFGQLVSYQYSYYIDNAQFTIGLSFRNIFSLSILFILVNKYYDRLLVYNEILRFCVLGFFIQSLISSFMWGERLTVVLTSLVFLLICLTIAPKNNRINTVNTFLLGAILTLNVMFFYRMSGSFVLGDSFF